MVGFISNLAPLLNYLRRRSPGPPFPPDHRQAGERGAKTTKAKTVKFGSEKKASGIAVFFHLRFTFIFSLKNLGLGQLGGQTPPNSCVRFA